MSGKADYTAGEWALLSELPLKVAIGAAVVQADEGTAGGDRQMLAAMKELAAAEEWLPDNELIQAVLLELKEEPGEETPREITIEGGAAWTALIDELLERSRQASELLATKATPREVVEFRQWLFDIAKEAVHAGESGGFLGIGGERVTDQEQAFLAELEHALGLKQ